MHRDANRLLAGFHATRDPSRLACARQAPRCFARTRRGTLCQSPAMPNGRCRMHGGCSRSGHAHGRYVHGERSADGIASTRRIRTLLADCERDLRAIMALEPPEDLWPD